MSYDEGRYQTRQMLPMIKATFATLIGTTATNTSVETSAAVSDRISFFKDIKLVGMKYQVQVAPDAVTHATSMTMNIVLYDGTTRYAAAPVGTLVGIESDASILSPDIDANTQLRLRAEVTAWDGTLQTVAPGGGWVHLEYQERF